MKPKRACSISVTICDDCGGVHIEFEGKDGAIFATAEIPACSTEDFVKNIAEQFAAIRGKAFATGAVH